MPTVKKTVVGVCVALLVALSGLVAVISLAQPITGYTALEVKTGSMEPTIPTHSVVFVNRSVQPNTLAPGDIVTYLPYSEAVVPITHRLQGVSFNGDGKRMFVLKGDSNDNSDAPVPDDAIYGQVVHTLPYAGYLYNPYIYVPVIAVLLLTINVLVYVGNKDKLSPERQEDA